MSQESLAIKSKAVYLDPESCGSSIGYRLWIDMHTYKEDKPTYSLSSYVDLADCSHKIDWCFNVDDVDKIDAAISILQDFRKEFLQTVKLFKKLEKE